MNKVGCKKNRFKTCLKDFIYAVNTVDMSESIKVVEQRKAAKRRKKRQKRKPFKIAQMPIKKGFPLASPRGFEPPTPRFGARKTVG